MSSDRVTGPWPILLAGPTASGKSALALALAERDGGVVINADALQVYSRWAVLTARPGPEDVARAPHALYGHVASTARYSVGHWLRELAPVLAEAAAAGTRPIVVGGTGLYLSALTSGLASIPEVPAALRATSNAMLARYGPAALRDDLARRDPESLARLDQSNPQRLQRAWEVLEATGIGLAEWQSRGASPLLPAAKAERIVLAPSRDRLAFNINVRLDRMVEAGALEECRSALAEGWDPALPSARALGARELIASLRGELTLQEAKAEAATATRRFAKRQRTWFRGRMADWRWLDPESASPKAMLAAIPGS